MEEKEASEIIEGFIKEPFFKKNFVGGSVDEAMKMAIKILGGGK